jgi:pimeloyl-ACP methyl ester carboxylesterase
VLIHGYPLDGNSWERQEHVLLDAVRDEQLIADLTVIEVPDGPHNIGWTFPDQVNPALLEFLSR